MKRLLQWVTRAVLAFDWPLLALLVIMTILGMTIMHSAVGGTDWRFADQSRNFLIAFVAMGIAAMLPPPLLMRLAPYIYVAGVVLLLGVEFFGETSKGATRWLDLGFVRLQPSEMLKFSVPLTLAWYLHRNRRRLQILDFVVTMALLALPFALIVMQVDLGTEMLVLVSGFCVI